MYVHSVYSVERIVNPDVNKCIILDTANNTLADTNCIRDVLVGIIKFPTTLMTRAARRAAY